MIPKKLFVFQIFSKAVVRYKSPIKMVKTLLSVGSNSCTTSKKETNENLSISNELDTLKTKETLLSIQQSLAAFELKTKKSNLKIREKKMQVETIHGVISRSSQMENESIFCSKRSRKILSSSSTTRMKQKPIKMGMKFLFLIKMETRKKAMAVLYQPTTDDLRNLCDRDLLNRGRLHQKHREPRRKWPKKSTVINHFSGGSSVSLEVCIPNT